MSITLPQVNVNNFLADQEFRLNHGDLQYTPEQLGSDLVRRRHLVFKGVYDFTVQGGAISTINLMEGVAARRALALPANFLINKVLFDVLIAPVGSGASLAFSSGQTAADLLAATAITSFTVNTRLDGIPTTAAASSLKVPSTQASPGSLVTMAITTAALTAGKINVFIQGFLSD